MPVPEGAAMSGGIARETAITIRVANSLFLSKRNGRPNILPPLAKMAWGAHLARS
ncbi:MAG: hypothetical protein ING16_08850 [Roseomonas sp.]|nr:hypothetical protein [Roseomonas sp.]MCA3282964.1 hypothetical protein [Roseomonas sp.]MCA3297803.1 hypothetical protein [Roseomonas sp.]